MNNNFEKQIFDIINEAFGQIDDKIKVEPESLETIPESIDLQEVKIYFNQDLKSIARVCKTLPDRTVLCYPPK